MLKLSRPLAVLDIETTGTNVVKDRIIELYILKINPDNSSEEYYKLINPGIKIPREASDVHGIKDKDVADKPDFKSIAHNLEEFLTNCDLAGYNSNKFDIPMLMEEFLRCGVDFDITKRKLIDVQNIFHKMEPRTLKAAYRFYCDKELYNAHGAKADTRATYEVLVSQIEKYKDTEYTDQEGNVSKPIKNDINALHDFSFNQRNVDLVGHIGLNRDGEEIFNFGKHKGKRVKDVFKKEPQYYDWMIKADFPLLTKNAIKKIKLKDDSNNSGFVFKE